MVYLKSAWHTQLFVLHRGDKSLKSSFFTARWLSLGIRVCCMAQPPIVEWAIALFPIVVPKQRLCSGTNLIELGAELRKPNQRSLQPVTPGAGHQPGGLPDKELMGNKDKHKTTNISIDGFMSRRQTSSPTPPLSNTKSHCSR